MHRFAINNFSLNLDKIHCINFTLDDIRKGQLPRRTKSNSFVSLLYAGALYKKIRNPEFMLSVLSQIENIKINRPGTKSIHHAIRTTKERSHTGSKVQVFQTFQIFFCINRFYRNLFRCKPLRSCNGGICYSFLLKLYIFEIWFHNLLYAKTRRRNANFLFCDYLLVRS